MATGLEISVKPLDVARRLERGHPVSVPPCAAENDAGFMEGRVPAPGPKKGFIASGVRTGRTPHARAACSGLRFAVGSEAGVFEITAELRPRER